MSYFLGGDGVKIGPREVKVPSKNPPATPKISAPTVPQMKCSNACSGSFRSVRRNARSKRIAAIIAKT